MPEPKLSEEDIERKRFAVSDFECRAFAKYHDLTFEKNLAEGHQWPLTKFEVRDGRNIATIDPNNLDDDDKDDFHHERVENSIRYSLYGSKIFEGIDITSGVVQKFWKENVREPFEQFKEKVCGTKPFEIEIKPGESSLSEAIVNRICEPAKEAFVKIKSQLFKREVQDLEKTDNVMTFSQADKQFQSYCEKNNINYADMDMMDLKQFTEDHNIRITTAPEPVKPIEHNEAKIDPAAVKPLEKTAEIEKAAPAETALLPETQKAYDTLVNAYSEKKEFKEHPVLLESFKKKLAEIVKEAEKQNIRLEINCYDISAPSKNAPKIEIKQSKEREKTQ